MFLEEGVCYYQAFSWQNSTSLCPASFCTPRPNLPATQQWPQDWKRSVFIPIPKKGNVKECSNYCTVALISHARKVMLKILQARLQQYVNRELPDVQAGFRKGRGTRDQIANIHWIIKKARDFQKKKQKTKNNLFLFYLLCLSLGLCGLQ